MNPRMTPQTQRTFIVSMAALIVACVMMAAYIWFTETRYPLFGQNYKVYEENLTLKNELNQLRLVMDSVSKNVGGAQTRYEVTQQLVDSLACTTCAGVENLNGHHYQLFGTFQSKEDAVFTMGQLLKLGMKDLKLFRREGLAVQEEGMQTQ